jgi:hypothetical protein
MRWRAGGHVLRDGRGGECGAGQYDGAREAGERASR